MKLNWNFLGGGGGGGWDAKQKSLLWGEYGYFLELYTPDTRLQFYCIDFWTSLIEIAVYSNLQSKEFAR